MKYEKCIFEKFDLLGKAFLDELEDHAKLSTIKSKTEIISLNDRISFLPIVIKGSIRVYTLNDGKEVLYYYLKPGEICVMTLVSILKNCRSKVYVFCEKACEVLLIPVSSLIYLMKKYPEIHKFFFREYQHRFISLMDIITNTVFHKLDRRIFNYVYQCVITTGENPIKITHKEIALRLGVARESVSRELRRMVNEGLIIQNRKSIEIIIK